MNETVRWVLIVLLAVLVIPPLTYIISRVAAIGWRRGNQIFDDFLREKKESDNGKNAP